MENTITMSSSIGLEAQYKTVAQSSNNTLTTVIEEAVSNKFNSFEDLDGTNRDRYYNLSGAYGRHDRLMILSHVTQYSINSWKSVNDKIQFISDGNHLDPYFVEISKHTEVDCYYSDEDIIDFIAPLRRKLGLPAYRTNVARQCARDFIQMYLAHPTMSSYNDPKTKKPFISGYTLLFNLDCQI